MPVSPARWARLSPLLDVVLELEPEARGRFIDHECAGDDALRAQLLALVASCEITASPLDAAAATQFAALLVDDIVLPAVVGDRYRIVRKIGQGGMATVFLARDAKHGRDVALKVMHADVANTGGRRRFEQETGIAARLSHPHILPLHDSGEVVVVQPEGMSLPFFVSPFVDGETLRERLQREHHLPIADASRIAIEIALGLDYAHRQGIVHLDIKPENVLLQEGHAIIADFGIAHVARSAEGNAQRAHAPLGTPAYMSAEHRAGSSDVDSRSDIYSLGCVLYEMITGVQFRPERDVAMALSDEPASRCRAEQALRAYASQPLTQVVLRAVSTDRDARQESGVELANDIRASSVSPRTSRSLRVGVVLSLAAVVAFAAGISTGWFSARPALDPDLIAVAPFDVASTSLALWHEGMVDVLARNLDGAGPLRSVAATTVVHGWSGHADAASAQALAERTGAELVVFGGLLQSGDSARATAVLYDARHGRRLAEFERKESMARMDRLSDSLTVSILRELSDIRRIDVARATAAPTNSLAALKLYLQGEQLYRSAEWDSAQVLYQRAIRLDTAFAMAYHRLAGVLKPGGVRDASDSLAHAVMRMPARFQAGLAPRERMLAVIDSLSADAYFAWNPQTLAGNGMNAGAIVGALYAAIDAALLRYPADAEFSHLKADTRGRYEQDVGYGEFDDRALLALYDRSIALDSSFAPAYVMPVSLSAFLDGADEARRYVRAYHRHKKAGTESRLMLFARRVFDSDTSERTDMMTLLQGMNASELCEAGRMMRHIPDSSELVRLMTRVVMQRAQGQSRAMGSGCVHTQIVEGLQFRGHLREAHALAMREAHYAGPVVLMGLEEFHVVAADSTRATLQRILTLAPRLKIPKLMAWWARDGDTLAVATYLHAYQKELRGARGDADSAMLRANVAAAQSYLALAHRDTARAMRHYLSARDTLHACWGENRSAFASVVIKAGRTREALRLLQQRWPGTSTCSNGLEDVMWTMHRARLFEQTGRTREALDAYTFVADAWRNADAELQPIAKEAGAAVHRLQETVQRASMSAFR